MSIRPVSEAVPNYFNLDASHQIVDQPIGGKYLHWGYSIGYLKDEAGNDFPPDGNTAFFNIHRMTEPVLFVKQPHHARFNVTVLAGRGALIRAFASGGTRSEGIKPGSNFDIQTDQAYTYINLGPDNLVLHDVARPPFEGGDEIELVEDDIKPSARIVAPICSRNPDGTVCNINIPERFLDLIKEKIPGDDFVWLERT